jgi:hypothetical protein
MSVLLSVCWHAAVVAVSWWRRIVIVRISALRGVAHRPVGVHMNVNSVRIRVT